MEIIAVIVTYNRLELLKKCIKAVDSQIRKPDQVIVVNSGSTDGTAKWLSTQPVLSLTQENKGGAAGFSSGIKKAYELGAEWIWLMDGIIHEMNRTYVLNDLKKLERLATSGTEQAPLIQFETFVSMLLSNELFTKRSHNGKLQFWITWNHRMFIMPFRIMINRKDNRWSFIKEIRKTSLAALTFKPSIEGVKLRGKYDRQLGIVSFRSFVTAVVKIEIIGCSLIKATLVLWKYPNCLN